MFPISLNHVKSLLCLGAHSDDIEIGCGGTLLSLLDARPDLEVTWVVFGAQGPRADEARRSAQRFLGAETNKRILIKGFRDSYFPYLGAEVKQVMEEVRNCCSPDLIFTHHRHDLHQDHRLLGELTWCAFRDHLILEYEIVKYDGDLGRPNCFVPLQEASCQRKIDLIMEGFPSQQEKRWFTQDTYWSLLRLRGVECHSPTRFAEAFHASKITLSLPAE